MNDRIIELYESGKSSYEVSKLTGVSPTQVRRILKKFSVQMKDNKTSDLIEEKIINRYISGESSEKISKDFDLNGSTICRILKRRGVTMRSASKSHRQLMLNEDVLDIIDVEWKAYFLGFMYADGNVNSQRNAFSFTLHKKDVEILNRFSQLFYGENRVVCRKEPYVNLSIYSERLKERLIAYGCVPNKTFKITMPDLPSELIPHFIRGLYDGDGCISTANNRVRIILTGYVTFLNEIHDLFEFRQIQSCIRLYNHKVNVADLTIGKQADCISFLNWIYQDATIFLDRKYLSYQKVLELCQPAANYGTSNIVSYNGTKLTGKFVASLPIEERMAIASFLLTYFRRQGFPYPRFDKSELKDDFEKLCNVSGTIDSTIPHLPECGLDIFKHFCPHYFEVRNNKTPSMLEVFNDDDLLMKVIQNRLGITYKETFNITGNMLRQGIRNSRNGFAASVFKPSLAKLVYDRFAPDQSIVLDISSGFGQRMLGAMASKQVKQYIGLDPWNKQIEALSKIKDFFNFDNIELHNVGSENFQYSDLINKVDLCFSSPPFFDKEIYASDNSQAYNNRTFEEFLEDWWKPTAQMVHKVLKENSYFIINMNMNMAKRMMDRSDHLFKEVDTFCINFKRGYLPSEGKDMYFVLQRI